MPSFLKITGKQKGVIKADIQILQHKDEIEIISWGQKIEYKKIDMLSDIDESIDDIKENIEENNNLTKENKKQIEHKIMQLEQLKNNFYAKKSGNSREFLHSIQKWHTDTFALMNTMQQKNNALIPQLKTQVAHLQAAAHLTENDDTHNKKELIEHFSFYNNCVQIADTETVGGKININPQSDIFSEQAEELAEHEPFEFQKQIDSASALLLDMCCCGEKLTECVFSMYRPMSSNETNGDLIAELNLYMRVTLRDAYISSYQINQSNDELPIETFRINYDEAEFVFVEGNVLIGKRGTVKPTLKLNWKI